MRFFILIVSLVSSSVAFAQDEAYVKELIDSLCAPRYHGRGYVEQGDVKASQFIAKECMKLGVNPVGEDYFQPFFLGVNTYPGEAYLSLNEVPKIVGADWIMNPGSQQIQGDYQVVTFKEKWAGNEEKVFKLINKGKFKNKLVLFDQTTGSTAYQTLIDQAVHNPLEASGYVVITDKKHTWSVGRRLIESPVLYVTKDSNQRKVKVASIDLDQAWIDHYKTQNVVSIIPGKSDSMVVFTAHYDHLGRMGAKTYIAGASDNASGSAMLLDLARHYKENPPEYTTVFIWFAGEEAGLVGSSHFVEHPMIDLEKIKFLLNLDLMGDAEKGITVVNGKVFTESFDAMKRVNDEGNYLSMVKARGSTANSDHYPFYEKGVPSFFIYTVGSYKHYHDIYDVPENLPLTNYSEVFNLVVDFVEKGL